MTKWSHLNRYVAAAGCLALSFLIVHHSSYGQNWRFGDRGNTNKHRRHVPGGLKKIKHIVFLVKENRTFDNYFGTFPGADGATSGTISTGEVIPLGHAPDMTPNDIDHSFQGAVKAIDGGLMDRFDLLKGGDTDVNGTPLAYTQYTEDDIPNYFAYA